MKHAVRTLVALIALLAGSAPAAEPAQAPQAISPAAPVAKASAADPDAVVPKREVKFVVSPEEMPITFQAGVPGILDQRFVAQFACAFKSSSPWTHGMPTFPFSDRGGSSLPGRNQGTQPSMEVKRLEDLLSRGPMMTLQRPFQFSGGTSIFDWIGRLRPERLPPADVLSDIKKQMEFGASRPLAALRFGEESWAFNVMLLAPTAERAEADARAMLTLIDDGFLYPLYKDFRDANVRLEDLLRESQEKVQEQARQLSAAEKEFAEVKELPRPSRESIANLASQGQMVTVDEAGVKARIDACNKILEKRKDLNPNRVEQVETVKVAAEIELVGLSAKRKALEEILKKLSQHESLLIRLGSLQRGDSKLKDYVSRLEEKRTALQATLEPKTFFGQIVGLEKGKEVPGTIFIHKIKWVEPEPAAAPGPAKR